MYEIETETIGFEYPEIFLFTLHSPKKVIEYLKYFYKNDGQLSYLLLPHFFILDGDYKIQFTDVGVVRSRYQNFKVDWDVNVL